MKGQPLITNRIKKKKCGCWDCCRRRGETPKMEGNPDVPESGGAQRKKSLFPGAGSGTIPPNSDITGADRPGYGKKRRKR